MSGEVGGGWDRAAEAADALPDGWRRHARRAHEQLFRRWAGSAAGGRWLKTDLQEERLGGVRALVPRLEGTWVGVDASRRVVQEASAAGVVGTVADVRCVPFADASFDGVLSTSTLDHFHHRSEIDEALTELRRVLRPGGRLILTLDNPHNPLLALRNALPRRAQTATGLVPYHVGPTYSEGAGRAALERTGFRVEATTFLLHAPHLVGTRAARWHTVETRVLPFVDRVERRRGIARFTGHFVAFAATAER